VNRIQIIAEMRPVPFTAPPFQITQLQVIESRVSVA